MMGVKGPGVTEGAADATWVILAPVAVGQHTLNVRCRYGPPVLAAGNTTYHLTVSG